MAHAIEVQLAKEIVLPALALVREQAGTVRVGQDLNGAPLNEASLSDLPSLLGLFGKQFEETAVIRIEADIAPPLVRTCALLRFHLRVSKLSAIGDEPLQLELNSENEYGVEPAAVTAYLFLGTLQELAIQHFVHVLAEPALSPVRRRWSRLSTLFSGRSEKPSVDEETWVVVVRDDAINTMSYVTIVFRRVLGLTEETARRRMQEVHEHKRSSVWEGPQQEAEARMRELRSWHLNALVEAKPAAATADAADAERRSRGEDPRPVAARVGLLSRLFRRSPKPLDNVSPRAQWLLLLSRKQADRLRQPHVEVEHLLLALLELREGVAYSVLQHLRVDMDAVRNALDDQVEHGTTQDVRPSIPYTPRFKAVLDDGSAEAIALGHDHLGTEHILLGILHADSGLAATLLKKQGLSVEGVRKAVQKILPAKLTS